MKKVLFMLMSALIMSLVFTACGNNNGKGNSDNTENVSDGFASQNLDIDELLSKEDSSSSKQLVALNKILIKAVKNAHIRSENDALALKDFLDDYSIKTQELQKEIEHDENKEMEDAAALMALIPELKALNKEVSRLSKEAIEAGLDPEEYGLFEEEEETDDSTISDEASLIIKEYETNTREFVEFITKTHLKGPKDAEGLKKAATKYQTKMKELQKKIEKLNENDKIKVAEFLLSIKKELDKIETENDRLEKEAKALGVEIDD